MKKLFKIMFVILFTITVSGCNSREDVDHMSQEELIKYINYMITEKVEFIDVNTDDVDNYIYTFKMVDRNINFEIEDKIVNKGLNIDESQFYDDYHRLIVFDDYVMSITDDLEQQRLKILKKYSFTEEYYETLGNHTIDVKDKKDLAKLSEYIVEIDKLYHFNIRDLDEKESPALDLKDLITFSDGCAFYGVPYSTDKQTRLEYKKVYKELKKQYKETCLSD